MAFIFVPLLAMTMMYLFALWVYASRYFVLIVEDTAAGNEVPIWNDEPLMDWVWQGFYMFAIVAAWLSPAFLFGRLVTINSEPYHRPLYILLVTAAAFWAMFPVSLLSSMAAESRWTLLHFGLLQRLAKRSASFVLFYVLSFIIVILVVPLIYWLIVGDVLAAIAFGLGVGTALFIYARLLGRLACLVRLTYIRPRRKKRGRRSRGAAAVDPWEVPAEAEHEVAARSGGFVQPRELPALETPDEEASVGYDVKFESAPAMPELTPERDYDDDAMIGADVDRDQLDEEARQLRQRAAQSIQPDKIEADRLRRKREVKPERPLVAGSISFLFAPSVSVHWIAMSVGFAFLGLLVVALKAMWPM